MLRLMCVCILFLSRSNSTLPLTLSSVHLFGYLRLMRNMHPEISHKRASPLEVLFGDQEISGEALINMYS